MKNKITEIIFICVSLALCIITGVSSFFGGADSSIEQRELTVFPSFIKNGKVNDNFDSELSDFLTEKMAFRSSAVKIKTAVMQKFFRSSAADNVIIGKNNWLYFSPSTDEYISANTLDERSIYNITDTLEQIDSYCNKRSVNFIFTVAPNKNTLYGDNMPLRFIRGENNNFDRLAAKLNNSNINFVDFHDFNKISADALYYKTDTHWNMMGAAAAFNLIMNEAGIEHTDYYNMETVESEKVGDLMKMLRPYDPEPEKEQIANYTFNYKYTSRFRNEEDINIKTENAGGNGSLLMFRDSFGNALLPYMAEQYKTAYFSRAVPVDLSSINQYDTVIYEIVQRNLKNILLYAPIMAAEKCSLAVDKTEENADITVKTEQTELVHIYGDIEEKYINTYSNIYICLTNRDGEDIFFRSFNISEASLYGDENCRSNGFSCRIDKEDINSGAYTVGICIKDNNNTVKLTTDSIITIN